jgi:hypothetical protein
LLTSALEVSLYDLPEVCAMSYVSMKPAKDFDDHFLIYAVIEDYPKSTVSTKQYRFPRELIPVELLGKYNLLKLAATERAGAERGAERLGWATWIEGVGSFNGGAAHIMFSREEVDEYVNLINYLAFQHNLTSFFE